MKKALLRPVLDEPHGGSPRWFRAKPEITCTRVEARPNQEQEQESGKYAYV